MRLFLIVSTLLCFVNISHAALNTKLSALEVCLNRNLNQASICAAKHIKLLNQATCEQATQSIRSSFLKENFRDFCFYQVSEFTDLSSCLKQARQFQVAENHDAALFNCIQQFKPSISAKQCLKLSQFFKYNEKRAYLKSQCDLF